MTDRCGVAPSGTACGRLGEGIAALYLEMNGYRILGRNLRCGPLEVDIVAVCGSTVAFVEVRTRSSVARGRPEASVGYIKRRNLTRSALSLLGRLPIPADPRLRFDVIAIERIGCGLRLRHLHGCWTPAAR